VLVLPLFVYLLFLNRFATLENLSNGEGINRDLENIKEIIKTAAKKRLRLRELKQHKPRFDEECSHFLSKGSTLNFNGYRIQTKAM
jgi:hypothetical protein